MHNALGALSPLDGRYSDSVKELNAYFSEASLMRYRIYVEVEYLIALGHEKKINERTCSYISESHYNNNFFIDLVA